MTFRSLPRLKDLASAHSPDALHRRLRAGVAVFFPIAALVIAGASARAQDLAITQVTVYASPDAQAQHNATVVIRHGLISAVGPGVQIPKGVATIVCQGCVVMAGFWNAHVHFMEPKWNDAAHQPAEKLTEQMRAMLTHSGFTTVVDTGSDSENTVALRRRVESGEVAGPRIFTSGIPLFPAHALPYYLADLPPEFKAKMAQPETPAEAAAVVDKNRAGGTDIVKLFTGSIVRPDSITPMRVDIAHAAVEEAHKNGQLVFAHSSNLPGTKVAIEAGVDVLAHTPEETSGIDEAMLRRMLAQHMTIIPTLKLFSHDDAIAKVRGLDLQYHGLGGRLVYGTDTGFLTDYDQGEEFKQLGLAGFGFRAVLAMLTTAPAELFHLETSEGRVGVGMQGDLTVLSADPASGDLQAFTTVRYTVRAGKVIWQRGDEVKK
jgi:imidazolonepropionase-like amidohydrolase